VLMSLIRYGSHTAAQYSSLEALAKIVFIFQEKKVIRFLAIGLKCVTFKQYVSRIL